jgi:hypothetical protein
MQRLRRAFDISQCSHCGPAWHVLAVTTDPLVIAAIPKHIGTQAACAARTVLVLSEPEPRHGAPMRGASYAPRLRSGTPSAAQPAPLPWGPKRGLDASGIASDSLSLRWRQTPCCQGLR